MLVPCSHLGCTVISVTNVYTFYKEKMGKFQNSFTLPYDGRNEERKCLMRKLEKCKGCDQILIIILGERARKVERINFVGTVIVKHANVIT